MNTRVCLEFSGLSSRSGSPLEPCWLLVDTEGVPSIHHLARLITERFDLGEGADELRLTMGSFALPGSETTAILRDNDLIV